MSTYDSVQKSFHWLMAVLIVGLWCVGLVMEDLPKGDVRSQVIGLHKAFGVVVLVLAAARLGWRATKGAPQLPPEMPAWEKAAAKLGHVGLYALMIALPVDGILLSQTGGRAVSVFGLVLPTFVEKNLDLKEVFEEGHELLAWVLAALVLAHVAAALRHHFLLKDDVLRRMLPNNLGRGQ